jgi:hypothetical protein
VLCVNSKKLTFESLESSTYSLLQAQALTFPLLSFLPELRDQLTLVSECSASNL